MHPSNCELPSSAFVHPCRPPHAWSNLDDFLLPRGVIDRCTMNVASSVWHCLRLNRCSIGRRPPQSPAVRKCGKTRTILAVCSGEVARCIGTAGNRGKRVRHSGVGAVPSSATRSLAATFLMQLSITVQFPYLHNLSVLEMSKWHRAPIFAGGPAAPCDPWFTRQYATTAESSTRRTSSVCSGRSPSLQAVRCPSFNIGQYGYLKVPGIKRPV